MAQEPVLSTTIGNHELVCTAERSDKSLGTRAMGEVDSDTFPPHPDPRWCMTEPLLPTAHAHRYGGVRLRSMTISQHLPANAPLRRIRGPKFRRLNGSACRWWAAGASPAVFTPNSTPALARPPLRLFTTTHTLARDTAGCCVQSCGHHTSAEPDALRPVRRTRGHVPCVAMARV